MAADGRVWLMGAGAFAARRLPVGLFDRLRKPATVFTIIKEPVGLWLPLELRDASVVRLGSEFTNAANRIDNYERIAQRVFAGAQQGGDVIYLTYGSPVVYDRVVSLIQGKCIKANITCTVIPATSSVDALLACIGEDMAPGLQVCEARWLVQRSVRLDPRVAALLFQVGVFWTDGLASSAELETSRLSGLRDYLLGVYPGSHPVLFVRAPFAIGDDGYFNCRSLGQLTSGVPQDLMDTSLYIPSVDEATWEDKAWWRRIGGQIPVVV